MAAKYRAVANLRGGEIKKDQLIDQRRYESLEPLEQLRFVPVNAQVTVYLDAEPQETSGPPRRSRAKTEEKKS